MKDLLKNRNIVKLLISNAVTRYGDSVETIVFSWIVYELTGSLSIMGMVFTINFLPNLILSPFAGVFADRHNRKRIIVISDIVRGTNAAIIAAMLLLGQASVMLIVCFSIVNSTFESFASPARSAFIIDVVPDESYMQVLGLNTSVRSFAELAGLASAGLLVLLGGNGTAIMIDGATFFLSALGISLVSYSFTKKENIDNSAKAYLSDIISGFKFVTSSSVLLLIVLCTVSLNFLFTPLNILMPSYADTTLYLGINGVSIMQSAIVVGLMLGGLFIAKMSNIKNLSLISIVGFFIMAATYLMYAVIPMLGFSSKINIVLVAVNSALFGSTVPIIASPLQKKAFSIIPAEKRGITSALIGLGSLISMPLGGAIIGIIGDAISVQSYFVIASIGIFILSTFLIFNKTFHEKNDEILVTAS